MFEVQSLETVLPRYYYCNGFTLCMEDNLGWGLAISIWQDSKKLCLLTVDG